MPETIIPGTYIIVRSQELISAGRVATGIIGVVRTAEKGLVGANRNRRHIMKAIVCDNDILKTLDPRQVEAYLQSKGWHERNRVPAQVSSWTRDTFAFDKLKIYLPLNQDFDDYPRRMYEVMEILEIAENRSQLDILSVKCRRQPLFLRATPSKGDAPEVRDLYLTDLPVSGYE